MTIIGLAFAVLQFHSIFVHLEVPKTRCLPTEVIVTTKTYDSKANFVSKTSCKDTCPGNQYVFQEKCFDNCPILTFKQDNGFIKYCINSPHQDLECLKSMCNKQLPYCFNGYCLTNCPEYTVHFNKTCLMNCPEEAPYMTANSCDGVCYSGEKYCSATCPKSHPFVFNSRDIKHCLRECPDYTTVSGYSCDTVCPHGFPLLFNRSCTKECPTTSPLMYLKTSSFNMIWVCTKRCLPDMASYKNVCVSVCPKNTYLDSKENKECVEKCGILRPFVNANPDLKSSIYHQQCLSHCPLDKYAISQNNISHCVKECPKNFSLFNYTCLSQCPKSHPYKTFMSMKENQTLSCVKYCEDNDFLYNDTCYSQCPGDLVHYSSKCVDHCFGSYPFLYKHNRTCVQECSKGHVLNRNVCDEKCPTDLFYVNNGICSSNCNNNSLYVVSDIGSLCIDSDTCPKETVMFEDTKECIRKCPMKTHIVIGNVCSNVNKCPNSSYFIEDPTHGFRCTARCPFSFLINGRHCVRWCPRNMVIVDETCIDTCTSIKPYGLRNESVNGTVCYSVCPDMFVKYLNECISHSMCLFGKKFYLYENTCYQNCPPHTIISVVDSYRVCDPINYMPSATDIGIFVFLFALSTLLFYLTCCFQGLPRSICRDDGASEMTSTTENLIDDIDDGGIQITEVKNQ